MGQQAARFKVRFGRDRGKRQRYRERETERDRERQRDRADNKNPEQGRVAQLVIKY